MKKLLLLSLLSMLFLLGMAKDYAISFENAKQDLNGIRINQNDFNTLKLSIAYHGVDVLKVATKKGTFAQLQLQDAYRTGDIGMPQLPSTKRMIQVPEGADVKVLVRNYDVQEYNLNDFGISNQVMPYQPSYPKNIDPAEAKFEFNQQFYSKNQWYSAELASVTKMGRLRGMNLAQLIINPIAYNPATNTIRVYNNLDIEIIFEGGDKASTLALQKKTQSPYFQTTYKSVLNAKDAYTDNPDHTKYPVKYLIITAPEFEDQLADFVAWKTKKGFEVIMVSTDEIGATSNEVKSWIHEQYNAGTETDPAPTFFLLVGDVQQIPESQTGDDTEKATDLYYACVDGNDDIFPDMYYGRFSAQNSTQLQNILDKVLYYEKYEFEDPSYLNKATLIAGADGTWNPRVGQPTINYGTEYYFNQTNGFTTVNAYLDSYSGCYNDDNINVSLINYTAHCSETSWADPALTQDVVNNFTNISQYPLAIGNCCLSADFGYDECMGETWMRKANAGAVAYIGSSPSSYWWEDYYWSVGAHDPVENQHPTFEGSTLGAYDAPYHSDYLCVDALAFVGNLAVTEAHNQGFDNSISTKYYWEAYNCLSDPSLYIYLTEGKDNNVEHLPTVPIGVTEYDVTAEPGSLVAISKDGVLYGTGLVPESGTVTVEMTPITDGGNVDIVVTRHQYKPYITQVPAAALDGPYLAVDEFTVVDESGNGEVETGEAFSIDLTLKNVGSDLSENILVSITSADTNVTLSNNTDIAFPNIEAETAATVSGKFNVIAKQNIPDQYVVVFDITITDSYTGKQEYLTSKTVKINAPNPEIVSVTYNDDYAGNEVNGILDAGETGDVLFEFENTGHMDYGDLNVQLSVVEGAEYVTLNTNMVSIENSQVSSTLVAGFNVTTNENTPYEEIIKVDLLISDDAYSSTLGTEFKIGEYPVYIMGEDELVTACQGAFFDSGNESANYGDSENSTITFQPPIDGNILQFTFESFDVEAGYDYLYVYNGLTTDAEQLAGSPFSGSNQPSIITATNVDGALTFKFTSDGYVNKPGWSASFECVDATAAPDCATNPNPEDGATEVYSSTVLSWEPVAGAISYEVYLGETLPNEPTAVVSTAQYIAQNLNAYTSYEWKVIPLNINGDAPETTCDAWTFTTGAQIIFMTSESVTTCDAIYTDPNGFENYEDDLNMTQTLLPGEDGKMLEITFTEFNMEEGYDYLAIYDASTANSNALIGEFDGSNISEIGNNGVIKATNAEGALTFKVYSDGSFNYAGWVANVVCADPDQKYHTTIKVYDLDGFVEGASVQIGDESITTDAMGEATFELYSGVYSYTVTSDYHVTSSGTIEVVDQDVSTDVVLDKLAMVTFHITVDNEVLSGATVTMDNNDYVSNEEGNATVLMHEGTFDYTVTMENYTTAEGTVETVYNMDTTINISLTYISVSENLAQTFAIYPNPSNGSFKVMGTDIKSATLINTTGVRVAKKVASNAHQIEFNQIAEGIYFLQIVTHSNQVAVKKVSIVK